MTHHPIVIGVCSRCGRVAMAFPETGNAYHHAQPYGGMSDTGICGRLEDTITVRSRDELDLEMHCLAMNMGTTVIHDWSTVPYHRVPKFAFQGEGI